MTTSRNIAANLSGRIWAALMSFAFVPFYIRFLGIEAYGLVGFFTSMLATLFVLDMGLSTTLNREMARLGALDSGRAASRTLLRTLELIYWVVGALICVTVIVAAPAIAAHWLHARALSQDTVTMAVRLIAVVLMLRWPVSLYQGALMGLRRHTSMNLVTSFAATLQGGGALLVLWLAAPTVEAFFLWQIVAAGVQIVLLVGLTWRALPFPAHRPSFSRAALRAVLAFSAEITAITVLSVVLTQLDKVMLSRLLPLAAFGSYSLAAAIAAVLTAAAAAVYGAIFPAFTHLVASDRISELAPLYHRSCQALSIIVLPAAIALAVYAEPLLQLYTSDTALARQTAPVLRLLTIGNMFLAIMMPPLALQLAFGWARLSMLKNLIAVIVFVPLLIVMIDRFGAVGAALVWIMLTMGYFIIEIQIMHRRLLPDEKWRWYVVDIGVPGGIAFVITAGTRLALPVAAPPLLAGGAAVLAALLSIAVSAVSLPASRAMLLAAWRHQALRGHLA